MSNSVSAVYTVYQGFSQFYTTNKSYFLLPEIISLLYVLLGLSYLTNSYLMPCVQKLVKNYGFSARLDGMLVSICVAFPQFFTNLIACLSSKPGMFGFGLGSIIGSGVYDLAVCIGIASIYSFVYHQTDITFELKHFKRDIKIYLGSLLYLILIFWDYNITFFKSLCFVLLTPLYLVFISREDKERKKIKNRIMQYSPSEYIMNKYNVYHVSTSIILSQYDNANWINIHKIVDKEKGDDTTVSENIQTEKMENGSVLELNPHGYGDDSKSSSYKWLENASHVLFLPYKILFSYTIPLKWPLIGFIIVVVYFILIAKYSVFAVDSIMQKLPFSHTFMGLMFGAWGGNLGDIFTIALAAKNKQMEIATSSIIGSQIFNLQICLGVPWLITCLVKGRISFPDPSIFVSILVVLILTLISFGLIIINKMKLDYTLGSSLIAIYLVYVFIESAHL